MRQSSAIPVLVTTAVALETGLFLMQWLLQYFGVGGLLRDILIIGASLCLLAWISWRLASELSVFAASVAALLAVWVCGYAVFPMIRALIEAAMGVLPWNDVVASLRGTAMAFLGFSAVPIVVAVIASAAMRRRKRRNESLHQA